MFKIGEFAKFNKISIKALRYYDELGLLKPTEVDFQTGYRYYSAKQLPRLNRILALKDLGFSLQQVSSIIENDVSSDVVISMLHEKKSEIYENIKSEEIRISRLNMFISKIKEDDEFMLNYDIVLKQIENLKVATLRGVVEDYSKQHDLWQELMSYLQINNAKIIGASRSVYYDPGYKESDVDIQVMVPVANDIPETDKIKIKQIPTIKNAACTIHKGSYENLSVAYSALLKWIEEGGYKIVGPNREVYLEGEWSTKNPEEYITEIQIPVEKNK